MIDAWIYVMHFFCTCLYLKIKSATQLKIKSFSTVEMENPSGWFLVFALNVCEFIRNVFLFASIQSFYLKKRGRSKQIYGYSLIAFTSERRLFYILYLSFDKFVGLFSVQKYNKKE